MDILSPMILLHGNGHKALAATKGDDGCQLVVAELNGKLVCVGKGNCDVTVGTAQNPISEGLVPQPTRRVDSESRRVPRERSIPPHRSPRN
jgi:hypothetical protein